MPNFINFARNNLGLKANGPQSLLGNGQYNFSSFTYPIDLGQAQHLNHYVAFYINETSNTAFKAANFTNTGELIGPGNFPQTGNNQPQITRSGTQIRRPIRRISTAIALYMPEQLQTQYSADWETIDGGILGAGAKAAQSAGEEAGLLRKIGEAATASGHAAMQRLMQNAADLTQLSVSDVVKAGGSPFAAAERVELNAHQEVLFRKIDFRTFNFAWKLVARNQKEAEIIFNIIQAFKFYAAPEINTSSAGRYFIYPAEFDIEFFSNGKPNEFLNKISTCALVDIQVNYNGNNMWTALREGSNSPNGTPAEVQLSLTFKELEIITKKRVLENY